MKSDHPIHDRRSNRLPGYDYSQPGAYFITIVTQGRECLFGEIVGGEMRLNDAGRIVEEVWLSLPMRYPGVALGAAVIMPNHFHGIVEIFEMDADPIGAIHELPLQDPQIRLSQRNDRRRMALPLVVGYFKMNSAKRINQILGSPGVPVWQRNYYEHILRNDEEHQRIHLYILGNPINWADDNEYAG